MFKEFAKFLREFNVVALAVAFIMGTASTSLVNSLVKDILMPTMAPLMSVASWGDAVFRIGSISIAYGLFVAELFNFLILALIVFVVARKLLKTEAEAKE